MQDLLSSVRRVLIKCSGEALRGKEPFGCSVPFMRAVVTHIQQVLKAGLEVALVVGGGNFFRGARSDGIGRQAGDAMGLMATVMNGLALYDACEASCVPAALLCAFSLPCGGQLYSRKLALEYLEAGRLLIIVGGIGHPFFTTDTAAVLRALELDCDLLMKATKVGGVYSADPIKDSQALFYPRLTYTQALQNDLRFMDRTAIALAQEHALPSLVFALTENQGFLSALRGQVSCSLVQDEKGKKDHAEHP